MIPSKTDTFLRSQRCAPSVLVRGSAPRARNGLFIIGMAVCILAVSSCQLYNKWTGKETARQNEEDNLIHIFFAAAYLSNPCNFAGFAGPSAAAMINNVTGYGSVKGRVLTKAGAPVVSALVIMDDALLANAGGTAFWGSHTSINRDGTFIIAGVPSGSSYIVSIEPVYSDFYNRIDTHLDCFMTVPNFTAGYFVSNGSITTTRASGTQFTGPSTGSTTDIGTTFLLQ